MGEWAFKSESEHWSTEQPFLFLVVLVVLVHVGFRRFVAATTAIVRAGSR